MEIGAHSGWAVNFLYKLYNIAPPLVAATTYITRQGMTWLTSEQFQEKLEGSLTDMPIEDSKIFAQAKGLKKWVAETFLDALRQGAKGLYREFELGFKDWGFKLEDLNKQVPISIWHGDKDHNVPLEVICC